MNAAASKITGRAVRPAGRSLLYRNAPSTAYMLQRGHARVDLSCKTQALSAPRQEEDPVRRGKGNWFSAQ
jgi:hypothetical protein